MHYDISLRDLDFGGEFSFRGEVRIEIQIREVSNEIVLNSHELSINGAKISGHDVQCAMHPDSY